MTNSQMVATRATTKLLDGQLFIEGLRWHGSELWFSDLLTRQICSVDFQGRKTVHGFLFGQPCGLGFRPDGSPLVVSMTERMLFRLTDTGPVPVADVSRSIPSWLNDMAVDKAGRAYIGPTGTTGRLDDNSADIEGGASPTGLVMVDVDGTVRMEGEGLYTPNGMAFTRDGRKLVVAESFKRRLSAFDVDERGRLSNRRIFADLGHRTPDGLCIDAEGNAWVACLHDCIFIKVREGGEVLETVAIGGWAITCALGGGDGRTLFCAAADTDMARLAKGEASAWIEMIQVDVPAA